MTISSRIVAPFSRRSTSIEREVQSHDGRYYQRRILPYRTADNHIEGAVVTFIDITERKQAEELLKTRNVKLEDRIASGTLETESLQQEVLSIAEEEQRRIGQDLHDDIGQELTGLAMKAETLQEIVVERQIPESAFAAEIVTGLDRIRGKVRALSKGMVSARGRIEWSGLGSRGIDRPPGRLTSCHLPLRVFRKVGRDRLAPGHASLPHRPGGDRQRDQTWPCQHSPGHA